MAKLRQPALQRGRHGLEVAMSAHRWTIHDVPCAAGCGADDITCEHCGLCQDCARPSAASAVFDVYGSPTRIPSGIKRRASSRDVTVLVQDAARVHRDFERALKTLKDQRDGKEKRLGTPALCGERFIGAPQVTRISSSRRSRT